ncbi:hypothetical protein D3C73_795740 [compost metagenome]
MCLSGHIIQIRHQAAFELGEEAGNIHGFVIVCPRHAVRGAAVQAAVAGEQAEGQPAFEHMRRSGILEAADIMAPEAEAGQAERQAAAKALCHRLIVRVAVAAPVNRELLPAGRCRACEYGGFIFAQLLFQYFKDHLVVQLSVVVVHLLRVGAVKVHHIGWNPFAEVRLEAVYAHIHQITQVACIPFTSRRVREIHESHARLPQIGLVYVAVCFFDQIAVFLAFFKQR